MAKEKEKPVTMKTTLGTSYLFTGTRSPSLVKFLWEKAQEGESPNFQKVLGFRIMRLAAVMGDEGLIRSLAGSGCPFHTEVCTQAGRKNNFSLMVWARENGCPWNEDVFAAAASYGSLEMVQWMRSEGCPWDEHVIAAAASYCSGSRYSERFKSSDGCILMAAPRTSLSSLKPQVSLFSSLLPFGF